MVEQAGAFSRSQEGLLALADISGYTAFIAQTEIDHSWEILHELLDTMVRTAEGRLEVSQVEGDCILFISGLTTPEVVDALEQTFVAFHRRLRDMDAVTTCPCNACANIGMLKLKFILHRGTFSRQRLGNVEQLHGADVIVAHRLLKNKVPSKEYILATDPVLAALPPERRVTFHPYSETYDLGVVNGGYEEIAHLWDAAQAKERKRVLPEEARFASDVIVEVSREVASDLMLKPESMVRYLFADRVDAFAGARGQLLGGEFHCHHGAGVSAMRVVSIVPGRECTLISGSPAGDMYITTMFEDLGEGRTLIRRLPLWADPPDPDQAATVAEMLEAMMRAGEDQVRDICAEAATQVSR